MQVYDAYVTSAGNSGAPIYCSDLKIELGLADYESDDYYDD